MQALVRVIRHLLVTCGIVIAILIGAPAVAAPYAAMVMDARTGEVIFARNHDTKLHPASLTKMMTLYVAFEAIKHGELTLDTMVTVSRRAVGTECVCLGLRAGQRISMRNLIRASALRSANDATVVIAEAISGSVEEFARRMTRTARAMGMSNTTFLNPHGLTQPGHLSTARDMTILGRQLFFDYPEYFNIFSRRSENAGVATVANTNRRFLDAYDGADGIKTGFTRAAGFNLTASARRGNRHIIATMFGGTSTAARNAHVAELLDIGFSRAPAQARARPPATPAYQGRGAVVVAQNDVEVDMSPNTTNRPASARTIRLQTAVRSSPFPRPRPDRTDPAAMIAAITESVDAAVSELSMAAAPAPEAATQQAAIPAPPPRPDSLSAPDPSAAPVDLAAAQAAGFSVAAPEDLAALNDPAPTNGLIEEDAIALSETIAPPRPRPVVPEPVEVAASAPASDMLPDIDADLPEIDVALAKAPEAETLWSGAPASVHLGASSAEMAEAPALQPAPSVGQTAAPAPAAPLLILTRAPGADPASDAGQAAADPAPNVIATAAVAEAHANPEQEIVSRLSTADGGRLWGVSLGEFSSRSAAERGIITVQFAEASALGNGISRIRQTGNRFEASFAGLTASEAERACLRLQARNMDCRVAGP